MQLAGAALHLIEAVARGVRTNTRFVLALHAHPPALSNRSVTVGHDDCRSSRASLQTFPIHVTSTGRRLEDPTPRVAALLVLGEG